jgi:hypothetical protein
MNGYRCSVRFNDPLVECCLVDVLGPECIWPAAGVDELIQWVHVTHILQNAEGIVGDNPVGVIHEVGGDAHEFRNLCRAALTVLTREVLAGPLGDVEGLPECGVVQLEVLNERVRICTVVMNSYGVNRTTSTLVHEVLEPWQADSKVRSRRRADEGVATVLEGLHSIPPNADCFPNTHKRLTRVVWLVEAKGGLVLTGLDVVFKLCDLVPAP